MCSASAGRCFTLARNFFRCRVSRHPPRTSRQCGKGSVNEKCFSEQERSFKGELFFGEMFFTVNFGLGWQCLFGFCRAFANVEFFCIRVEPFLKWDFFWHANACFYKGECVLSDGNFRRTAGGGKILFDICRKRLRRQVSDYEKAVFRILGLRLNEQRHLFAFWSFD